MSKLEKGLKEWVGLGFISPEQAKRIQQHESEKPESSWILSGLLILGVVIIGIGVISVIAANWHEIPDFLKLAADFSLLGVLVFSIVHAWELKRTILFEVLLLLFLILCLASIGLISQIYNTSGEPYQALMLWSSITVAAALAARQMFVPFIWTGTFLTGLIFMALDSAGLQPIFHRNYQAILMATPLLCAGLTVLTKSLAGEIGPTRALRSWTLWAGLAALAGAELHALPYTQIYNSLTPYVPGYFLAAIVAVGIWQGQEYRGIQKTTLLMALGNFLAAFHLPLLGVEAAIAYATFTIAILGLMALFLASLKERRLFQGLLLLLGTRFLILYFQALGGLATTGVGLILSGGVVIAMATLWNKYRIQLAAWTERWVQ